MIRSFLRPLVNYLKHHFSIPTSRTVTFLIAAFLLYLFGNQTQVGWMYVMSALLAGTVLAAWWLNRRVLRGVRIERRIEDTPNAELYEGDTVTIGLFFRNAGRILAAQIRVTERCPLAALDSRQRTLELFVPALLPRRDRVGFEYEVEIYRRGLYEFAPLELTSRAPFGFFRRHRRIAVPTRALVYPEVRRLGHLRLLDHRLSLEFVRPRAGVGTEILGVRPFHSGDSPRRIHWRSVARTGRLMSKEFVDETRPGLTVALDVRGYPYPHTESKHTPFEWAVKIAASIGDYTLRRGYPLYLAADDDAWPPPTGPITRLVLLEYLARVQPKGERPLVEVLEEAPPPPSPCVAVILPWPDPDSLSALGGLRHRGLALSVILLDPVSFPTGGPSAAPLADEIHASEPEVSLVRFGEDWREQIDLQQLSVAVNAYAHAHAESSA